ncbi:uncharacterized protein [Panulirus ornatus]|uniref:uncharacterized protein isoform X2 n=1 Tax=Panulirus ornatus TaxID=150431 RepID=UPI003A8486F8
MSALARRLATCVPQEVATSSSRRASCGALEIPVSSLLRPEAILSPSHIDDTTSPLHHAASPLPQNTTSPLHLTASSRPENVASPLSLVALSLPHNATSPLQVAASPLLQNATSPLQFAATPKITTHVPATGKPILRPGRRASVGPSASLLDQPTPEYLGHKRASLDPSWISPASSPKDESIRWRVWNSGIAVSPIQGFLRPASALTPAEPIPTSPQDPGPTQTPTSAALVRRRHTLHKHEIMASAPRVLRRQSCGTIIVFPSADYLNSPKAPDSSWSPSSVAVRPFLSTYLETTAANNTRLDFDREKHKCGEDGEDSKGKGTLGRERSGDGACLQVPKIAMNVAETISPKGMTLLGSPSLVVKNDYQHHTLPSSFTDGGTEGTTGTLRVMQEANRGGPVASTSRRASWHVFSPAGRTDSGFPHAGVITGAFGTQHCRHSPVVPCVGYSAKWRSAGVSPRVGSVIGRGGFGTVKVGRHRGVKVAVKVLRGGRAASSSRREAYALSLRPHAHLVTIHALVTPAPTPGYARISWADNTASLKSHGEQEETLSLPAVASMFGLPLEDATDPLRDKDDPGGCRRRPGWTWVVSELCTPHTLLTLINDPSLNLSASVKVRYTCHLARGLSYLHSQGLAHLDVKPANALLTSLGHLKLTDFGCCTRLGQADDPVLGTVGYQAPEVLRGEVGGTYSDMFSLGVTIWHLLTRTSPYQGLHPHVIIYQVARLRHRPTDHQQREDCAPSTTLEALLLRLAERCWAENPQDRPSAKAVCSILKPVYHYCVP